MLNKLHLLFEFRRLYYKKLKEIDFPSPSEITHSKAEFVLDSFYNEIILKKNLYRNFFKKLKTSILEKAFQGQLVEQIDSEGTGQELLDKILTLKEQQKPKKKASKKTSRKVKK